MSTIEKAAARLGKTSPLATGTEASPPPSVEFSRPADDVERLPPVAPSGHIDLDIADLVDRGFMPPVGGRSQIGQDLRRIKRPLLLHAQKRQALAVEGRPGNVVMVTSAVPGEGKTFISINLAISLAAELDHRVLLVDADLAKGDVARQLNIDPPRGLSDLLRQQSFVREDAVLTTNIDRLSILPSGSFVEHIDELYASDLMQDIIDGLAAEDPDRMIVFDAPPLLATTEAAVLARLMGQVVMVVESNNTPQSAVTEALRHLDDVESLSLLLNKATTRPLTSYGYGYGYSYGDGGERG